MSNTSKGIGQDRLAGIHGSKHIPVSVATGLQVYAFIAQEDTTVTLIKGGDSSLIGTFDRNNVAYVLTDYTTSMGVGAGVTLKQGALLTAPEGEIFTEITVTEGSIIAYS